MVMESLFTGNDYYCEEKYGPIANNCEIRHKAVYESLAVDLSANDMDKERMKAINKVILAKNKNVEQPETGENIEFTYPGKIVTILGQVVNDFSLLEYKNNGLSSINFYRDFIKLLISNGFNVVFKAHPWEENKTNINSPFTRNILGDYFDGLSEEGKYRLKIVDHYPIEKLFSISDFVAGLNSQSLIEAAFNGLKPMQFGSAFFGEKGFTNDYSLNAIEDCVLDMVSGKAKGALTLKEFNELEEFLRRLLQGQLISVHDSGVAKLESVFAPAAIISIAKRSPVARVENTNGPIALAKKNSNVGSGVTDRASVRPIPANDISVEQISIKNSPSPKNKKIRKLLNNPRKFFADSNNGFAKSLRHLFKPN